jgi:hypothetical protein
MDRQLVNFCKYSFENIKNLINISFSFRPNDQIISVNGHPVINHMEYSALKLIRESTDFVNLVKKKNFFVFCFELILTKII